MAAFLKWIWNKDVELYVSVLYSFQNVVSTFAIIVCPCRTHFSSLYWFYDVMLQKWKQLVFKVRHELFITNLVVFLFNRASEFVESVPESVYISFCCYHYDRGLIHPGVREGGLLKLRHAVLSAFAKTISKIVVLRK